MILRGGLAAVVAVVAGGGIVTPPVSSPALARPAPSSDSTVIRRDGAQLRFERFARTIRRVAPTAASPTVAAPTAASPTAVAPTAASPAGSKSARFDFDGDGRDEIVSGALAIDPTGTRKLGSGVLVDYSSRPYRDFLTPPADSPRIPDVEDPLTAGDFNADGYADLVVASQGEYVPGSTATEDAYAGAVWIFYGSASGLNPMNPQHMNQNTPGVPDQMEGNDRFGAALATGDLNGDGYDDLAVGAPLEDLGPVPSAGLVTVFFGSSTGITTAGATALTESSLGVADDPEAHDIFGRGLAVGDVTGDGYADLAVGAPGKGNASGGAESGMVALLRGAPEGLSATGATALVGHKDITPVVSELGALIRIDDINGDGHADVVVGAWNNNGTGGSVVYLPGSAAGLTAIGVQVVDQDTPGVPGSAGAGDFFGWDMATGDVTGDGRADVLVGAIGKDIGSVEDAGAVFLIPGSAAGLTGAGTQEIDQTRMRQSSIAPRRSGLTASGEGPDLRDYFGYSASILDLDGSGALDMVVGTYMEQVAKDNGTPSGMLATLRLQPVPVRSRSAAPRILAVGRWWSGADVSDSGMQVYFLGRSLLHR